MASLLNKADQRFATLSNLDMQQCPKMFCNFVQKRLAKNSGASDSRCGYRMYVVDKNGNLLSPVIDLVSQSPSYQLIYDTTWKFGGTVSAKYDMPSDMPKPFKHNGICFMGNGMKTKAWMRSKGSDGVQNIVALIQKYLGADVAEQFEDLSEEKFCVLEPIAWHNIYLGNKSTTNTGICFYGTFMGWMKVYAQLGLPNGGFTVSAQ